MKVVLRSALMALAQLRGALVLDVVSLRTIFVRERTALMIRLEMSEGIVGTLVECCLEYEMPLSVQVQRDQVEAILRRQEQPERHHRFHSSRCYGQRTRQPSRMKTRQS